MSHIVVMAGEMLWLLYILVVLFSAMSAHGHKGSQAAQRLSCVNDFINNISCTWNGSPVAPDVDCWINGTKRIWIFENGQRVAKNIVGNCKLEQHGASLPGCSFVFENQQFNLMEMLNMSMQCNGTSMENLTNYMPRNYIKMHPPGVPNVSYNGNETLISWSPGSPLSPIIKNFKFEVQLREEKQTWKEGRTLPTKQPQLKLQLPLENQLKGPCHVRVRVKSAGTLESQWSDWSPTTSILGATQDQVSDLNQMKLIWGAVTLALVIIVLMMFIYISCVSKWHLKVKPVPNPSKYFPTLQSSHGENLKIWLNPLSTSESFFMAQSCDHISQVEVCENWDVVPSTSPFSSSTSALLHIRNYASAGSDTSGVIENSSSSSCFSNMGYFMSSSSGSISRSDENPAYFTYQDDIRNLHNSHNLHLSLCPQLFPSSRVYESLKREPQSPDSGFGIAPEDKEDRKDEQDMDEEEVDLDNHQRRESSPFHIFPLHPLSRVCLPSSAPSPPHPPSLSQMSPDSLEVDDSPVADAGSSYAAWPVASAMCRSSSMPVEPCKTGYLTLKELQSTFSNKSI